MIAKYIDDMKNIQTELLSFLEDEENIEENYKNLINICDDLNINNDKHIFQSFLYLITKISNNHQRCLNFFNKIDQILQYFKDDIKRLFSNSEIFHIFKSNKRVLLFLIEEKLFNIDKDIFIQMKNHQYAQQFYLHYFSPEIKQFIKDQDNCDYNNLEEKEIEENLPDNFYENRKIGENESEICKYIRNDSIREFIKYINQNDISLKSKIQSSIYETNLLLIKKRDISLIEYAAFFGSIQIFNYLKMEKVEIPKKLYIYAIHGQNAEIIHIAEEQEKKSFKEFLKESIKCHNYEITNYILNNCIKNTDDLVKINKYCLKYYNFHFIKNEEELRFIDLCHFNYFYLVSLKIKETNTDINEGTIIK